MCGNRPCFTGPRVRLTAHRRYLDVHPTRLSLITGQTSRSRRHLTAFRLDMTTPSARMDPSSGRMRHDSCTCDRICVYTSRRLVHVCPHLRYPSNAAHRRMLASPLHIGAPRSQMESASAHLCRSPARMRRSRERIAGSWRCSIQQSQEMEQPFPHMSCPRSHLGPPT